MRAPSGRAWRPGGEGVTGAETGRATGCPGSDLLGTGGDCAGPGPLFPSVSGPRPSPLPGFSAPPGSPAGSGPPALSALPYVRPLRAPEPKREGSEDRSQGRAGGALGARRPGPGARPQLRGPPRPSPAPAPGRWGPVALTEWGWLPASSPGTQEQAGTSPLPHETDSRGWDRYPPRGAALPTPPTRVAAAVHSGVSQEPSEPAFPPEAVPPLPGGAGRFRRAGGRDLRLGPGDPAARGARPPGAGRREEVGVIGQDHR